MWELVIYEIWLINLLIIWGVYASFKPDMIFEQLDRRIRAYLYWRTRNKERIDYWLKPFYKCPICMPSVWGSTGFFLTIDRPLYLWPIYVVSMVGFNYIVSQLISKQIEVTVD
jgi:hypothetical protein